MSLNSFVEMNELQKSFLEEVSSIGSGNAATAVSEIICSPTDAYAPLLRVLSAADAAAITDKLCSGTAAYLITLQEDLKGSLLFLIPYAFAERLASTYFPDMKIRSRDDIDETANSVIQETVNIVAANFANNFAMMSGMTVDISVPVPVTAPSGDILAQNAAGTVNVCFVNNTIEICDCKKMCNVLFFPELESAKYFMKKMKVEC